ncbi:MULTISPECIES: SitI3 family protein [Actinoplanes]|uniref:SitI3 family protein n=1 Tax=Actinoplanes TaxID=1865 RepID=UPI0005F28B41|nr:MULTISPECIES: SitI3 family protein [Actinoplanes]GLY06972.1 hypothetical protein Acsp01_73510 [Actinoplanes sp. NBRC 101535]
MALEFDLQSDAEVGSAELRALIAESIGGAPDDEGRAVLRAGLRVMARRVEPGDRDETTALFGFEHRVTATFRFANLATEDTRAENTVLMLASVVAIHERFSDSGVLLHNGEFAVARWTPGELVFTDRWREWFDTDRVRDLVTGHGVRELAQPLL